MAPDEAGQKPYALLYDTLKRTGYVGVAKIAMHNREHIVIFRPGAHGLLMHTMYYANEVRKVEEFRTDTGLVKEQELKLAEMLVESLAAPFEPQKYHDTYLDNLQALIDAKVQGREVVTPPAAEPSKVIDIMEALEAEPCGREKASCFSRNPRSRSAKGEGCRKEASPRLTRGDGLLREILQQLLGVQRARRRLFVLEEDVNISARHSATSPARPAISLRSSGEYSGMRNRE